MKHLILLLLIAPCAFGAITERYVNAAGSGDGTGSSEANAMSYTNFTDYMVTGGSFTAAAGDRFNVKLDGTYARTTTTDTWVNGGSSTSPVIVRGYSSTIGDARQGRTNDNGPLVTTNMPVITYTTGTLNVTGTFIILEGLNVSGARNGNLVLISADSYLVGCRIANAAAGSSGTCVSVNGARASVIDCDATLSNGGNAGSAALLLGSTGVGPRVIGCRVTSTAIGINVSVNATGFVIAKNTVYGCAGVGITLGNTGAVGTIIDNTVVGGSSDGIDIITGTAISSLVMGNMITDNTGNGVDFNNAAVCGFVAHNRTRDNAAAYNLATDWVAATSYGDVTTDTGGASTDYTNSGGNDYSLISASPAVGAGLPKKASIGALQRDQTGAGGGGGEHSFIFAQ